MIFGSVCSGIEAASVAWEPLGWKAAWYSEIEKFPSAVLAHHYPNTPNYGDMTKFKEWPDGSINVLVGGTPCQSFSIAGLRKGLADPRGNLMLTFLAIAERYRPKWIVWENVPGVLSSNKGRDFGTFLGALVELGYGWSYRVLDAQYFGVAQRRRRVFVVAYFGAWQPTAAVLFERESLRGDSAPSRKEGEGLAPAVSTGAPFSRTGNERVEADAMVPISIDRAAFNQGKNARYNAAFYTDGSAATLIKSGPNAVAHPSYCPSPTPALRAGVLQSNVHSWPASVAPTLNAAFAKKQGLENQHALAGGGLFVPAVAQPIGLDEEQNAVIDGFGTLKARTTGGGFEGSVMTRTMAVRRLTPRECERLQGFPDDYTAIPWRNKTAADCPDGPRYKALGNSMAVPVMRWIGQRIEMVEALR